MWNSDDKGGFRQLQSKSIQAGSPAGLQNPAWRQSFLYIRAWNSNQAESEPSQLWAFCISLDVLKGCKIFFYHFLASHAIFSAVLQVFLCSFSSSFLEWLHRFVVYHMCFSKLLFSWIFLSSLQPQRQIYRNLSEIWHCIILKGLLFLSSWPGRSQRTTCEDKHQVPQHGIKSDWIAQNTLTHNTDILCSVSPLSYHWWDFLNLFRKRQEGRVPGKAKISLNLYQRTWNNILISIQIMLLQE